jgi:hypothetical protein
LEQITAFIDNCVKFTHYQGLTPRPSKFEEWRTNNALKIEYCQWAMHHSNCPSLKLDIPVPHQDMLREVTAQSHRFVKHRGEENPGWYSMAIHGQDVHLTQPKEYYVDVEKLFTADNLPDYNWTELADHCPVTKTWLQEQWPFKKFQRVRFMLLEPGGYITPHFDYEKRSMAAFNLAISNPPGVEFAMEDAGLIPWQPGEVRAIDIGRRHAVRHTGTEPRIHMIIHGLWGNGFEEMICRSFDQLLETLT